MSDLLLHYLDLSVVVTCYFDVYDFSYKTCGPLENYQFILICIWVLLSLIFFLNSKISGSAVRIFSMWNPFFQVFSKIKYHFYNSSPATSLTLSCFELHALPSSAFLNKLILNKSVIAILSVIIFFSPLILGKYGFRTQLFTEMSLWDCGFCGLNC